MLETFGKGLIEFGKLLSKDPLSAITLILASYLLTTLLNAIASVFIEDQSKKLWRMMRSVIKYRPLRKVVAELSNCNAHLDGIFDDIYLVDLNFSGYKNENCYGKVSNDRTIKEMPEKHLPTYQANLAKYEQEFSERRIFPELKIALQDFAVQRGRSLLDSGFVFDFEPRSYATQLAATDVYLQLSTSERSTILDEYEGHVARPFSNTFGVSVVVITADSKLVACTRSRYVRKNKGKIIFGAVEGSMESDIEFREQRLYPFYTARRGLETELGIKPTADLEQGLKLIALVLNKEFYEWNMISVCDCRKLKNGPRAKDFEEIFETGRAYDKFEFDEIEFIDFKPRTVIEYLRGNADRIVNYSRVGAILALYDEFGEKKISELIN